MSIFEWLNLIWMIGLTLWLLVVKRGPKGEKGDMESWGSLDSWNIRQASMELLDEPEYLTKLIQRINSYQLHRGDRLSDDQ